MNMNISRISLLTILFATASISCSELPATGNTEAAVVTPTLMGKISNALKSCVTVPTNAVVSSTDWIANKTYINWLVTKIVTSHYLENTRVNNPEAISRAIVTLIAAVAIWQGYSWATQNADDEDDFDFEYVASTDETGSN